MFQDSIDAALSSAVIRSYVLDKLTDMIDSHDKWRRAVVHVAVNPNADHAPINYTRTPGQAVRDTVWDLLDLDNTTPANELLGNLLDYHDDEQWDSLAAWYAPEHPVA